MGSTLGSILQTAGQTGNEIGAAKEANINQSHQFMMDYLANQARSRGLDIMQSGQEQTGRIAASQQDIDRQRLQQSRWQMTPGYTKIPHPDDPSKSLYRYTFFDPITKQQVHTDLDTPPVDSPEYKLNSFQDLRDKVKSTGLNIPDSTLMNIAFGKADTPNDINTKYTSLYNQMMSAPDGPAYMRKNYPGGLAEFVMNNVKADQKASSGLLSRQEQLDWLSNNPGRTISGQTVIPQADNALLKSLKASEDNYTKIIKEADDNIAKAGITGSVFNTRAYAEAIKTKVDAAAKLQLIQQQMENLNSRISGISDSQQNPQPAITTLQPSHINPIIPHPDTDKAQPKAAALGLTHKVIVNGQVVGYSREDKSDYHSVKSLIGDGN